MSSAPQCEKQAGPSRRHFWLLRPLFKLGGLVRRHPWASLVVVLFLVLASVGGVYLWGEYHFRAAQDAMDREELEQARENVEKVLWVWPRSRATHLLAARIYRVSADFTRAEQHLKECKRLQGKADEALQLEWLLYRAQTGEIDTVLPGLSLLVERKAPETPVVMEALVSGFMAEMRWFRAYMVLQRWLELDPDNAKALTLRGQVRLALASHEGATEDFERALTIDPGRYKTRQLLVEVLLSTSNAPEALRHIEIIHKDHPDIPDLLFALARCRLLQGRPDEARQYLDQFLAIRPKHPRALAFVGKVEYDNKRYAQAEEWLRRALKADPADVESRFMLYRVLSDQGNRKQEAQKVLEQYKLTMADTERMQLLLSKGVDENPADPKVPLEVGELCQRLGQPAVGAYWFYVALKRDPQFKAAHRRLADYYASINEPQKAESHRRRAE
jgi:tetratricopeptide (TPR) repeat protein